MFFLNSKLKYFFTFKYGVQNLNSLIIPCNKLHLCIAGDLNNGSDILNYLITQKDPSSDMIEEMDGDELEELIETADFLAVLFCKL